MYLICNWRFLTWFVSDKYYTLMYDHPKFNHTLVFVIKTKLHHKVLPLKTKFNYNTWYFSKQTSNWIRMSDSLFMSTTSRFFLFSQWINLRSTKDIQDAERLLKENKVFVPYFWKDGSPNFPEAETHKLATFDHLQWRNRSI